MRGAGQKLWIGGRARGRFGQWNANSDAIPSGTNAANALIRSGEAPCVSCTQFASAAHAGVRHVSSFSVRLSSGGACAPTVSLPLRAPFSAVFTVFLGAAQKRRKRSKTVENGRLYSAGRLGGGL